MTATARVDLGAATLARDWYLDVNTGTHASPTWTPVSGVMEIKPTKKAVLKDVSVATDGGAQASQKTADQWGLEVTLKRAPQSASPTAYDVGAEKLRVLANAYGAANLAEIRYYEVNASGPVTEAWTGYCAVEWDEDKSAVDDPRAIKVTLTGHGARTAVSPNPGSA